MSVLTIGFDTGTARDAVALLGVSVGVGAGWVLLDDPGTPIDRRERLRAVAVGLLAAGLPEPVVYVFDPALTAEFLASALVGVAAIAAAIAKSGTRIVRSG